MVYLDDRFKEASLYLPVAWDCSAKITGDSVQSGFGPISEKSLWVPTPIIDWLGFTIDLCEDLLVVPGKKIKRVFPNFVSILETGHSTAG